MLGRTALALMLFIAVTAAAQESLLIDSVQGSERVVRYIAEALSKELGAERWQIEVKDSTLYVKSKFGVKMRHIRYGRPLTATDDERHREVTLPFEFSLKITSMIDGSEFNKVMTKRLRMIARIEFDEAANWQDLAEAYKYLCTSPYPRFRSTGYTAWFLSNLHPNLRIPDRSKAAECDAAIAKTAAFFYPLER